MLSYAAVCQQQTKRLQTIPMKQEEEQLAHSSFPTQAQAQDQEGQQQLEQQYVTIPIHDNNNGSETSCQPKVLQKVFRQPRRWRSSMAEHLDDYDRMVQSLCFPAGGIQTIYCTQPMSPHVMDSGKHCYHFYYVPAGSDKEHALLNGIVPNGCTVCWKLACIKNNSLRAHFNKVFINEHQTWNSSLQKQALYVWLYDTAHRGKWQAQKDLNDKSANTVSTKL